MNIKSVNLIYFSATGTTQKVLESIAKGISHDPPVHHKLTLPDSAKKTISFSSDELVLMGAPVYGGRLPVDAVNRFKKLKGDNTLAILIVMYGNREFEDALLELKNLAVELGFNPIAGAAFIGEHSFSTKNVPIATGRPDDSDIQKATAFGANIKDKLAEIHSGQDTTDLVVPGKFPYEAAGARPMTVAPETLTDNCTVCGICADVCPTGAITVGERVETQIEACIRCCACIKSCPEEARVFKDEMMNTITNWLHENCSERKEPELFGVLEDQV